MTDINPTEASVKPGANAQTQEVRWGGTVTQGMAVYQGANGNYYAGDCTDAAKDGIVGIALTAGGEGQPGVIQTGGDVLFGEDDLAAHTVYVLSSTGHLCPAADYAPATDFLTVIGASLSADTLRLGIVVTGEGKTG
jgi:hypothetical protein